MPDSPSSSGPWIVCPHDAARTTGVVVPVGGTALSCVLCRSRLLDLVDPDLRVGQLAVRAPLVLARQAGAVVGAHVLEHVGPGHLAVVDALGEDGGQVVGLDGV